MCIIIKNVCKSEKMMIIYELVVLKMLQPK